MLRRVLRACWCAGAFAALSSGAEESMSDLKARADEVLKQTNVSARSDVEVVFQLVDRLVAENKPAEAETYLVEGLKLFPWNLTYQMRYAELLNRKGDTQQAKEKAKLVCGYSETDGLIERARMILGAKAPEPFPSLSKLPGTNCCVVLVPLRGCEKWLVSRVREGLADELHIPVYVQTATVPEVPFTRDRRQKAIAGMRRQIRGNLSEKVIAEGMRALKMKPEELEKDDQVVKLMRHVAEKESGQEAVTRLVAFLQDARGQDPQWDAEQLLEGFAHTADACRRENVAYIGLTPNDIYAKEFNFLFGWSGPRGAIVSYRRFTADFNRELPNGNRLAKRTLMQCLSSAGFIYGVERCTDPTCARAYPNSLSEHDAKKGTLCSECRTKFNAALGL